MRAVQPIKGASEQGERPAGLPCGAPRSDLHAESTSRARTLTGRTQAPQTLDEHGVGLESDRVVDEGVEHLVVPGGAHVEQLADGLLLGAGVLPPLALKGDDVAVAVTELAR